MAHQSLAVGVPPGYISEVLVPEYVAVTEVGGDNGGGVKAAQATQEPQAPLSYLKLLGVREHLRSKLVLSPKDGLFESRFEAASSSLHVCFSTGARRIS